MLQLERKEQARKWSRFEDFQMFRKKNAYPVTLPDSNLTCEKSNFWYNMTGTVSRTCRTYNPFLDSKDASHMV